MNGPIILIAAFAVLLFIGAPIAICLAASSIITVLVTNDFGVSAIFHRMVGNCNGYTLLALPFFILSARLMNTGSITQRLFRFAAAPVRHIPGGLAHANILASVIFAGMSGSAVADAGGLGQIELKAMRDDGFDDDFSAAITASSATVGPIIPPSVPMVVYGSIAEVSVGALFMGGFVPGILLATGLMILVYFMAKKRNYPTKPFSWSELWESFKSALLSILSPVILIGGIWSGVFTPTEASVVAVAYAFILSVIVYREIGWKQLIKQFYETVVDSGVILFIICGAAAFGWLLAMYGVTDTIANWVIGFSNNKYVIMLLLNIAFLIIGMFLEALSVLTITAPFLITIFSKVGLDPVHMGVVIVLNLMIGLCTPPVGTSLFVVSKLADISLGRMYKAILPFLIPLIAVLFLITYVPDLVLWLPRMLGMS